MAVLRKAQPEAMAGFGQLAKAATAPAPTADLELHGAAVRAALHVDVEPGVLNAKRNSLKDDELVIIQGVLQPDRFTGGFRLKVTQVWDLEAARCRFGKYLRVAVNGKAPDVGVWSRTSRPGGRLARRAIWCWAFPFQCA